MVNSFFNLKIWRTLKKKLSLLCLAFFVHLNQRFKWIFLICHSVCLLAFHIFNFFSLNFTLTLSSLNFTLTLSGLSMRGMSWRNSRKVYLITSRTMTRKLSGCVTTTTRGSSTPSANSWKSAVMLPSWRYGISWSFLEVPLTPLHALLCSPFPWIWRGGGDVICHLLHWGTTLQKYKVKKLWYIRCNEHEIFCS